MPRGDTSASVSQRIPARCGADRRGRGQRAWRLPDIQLISP